MIRPEDVPRIVSDAARLVRRGDLIVFGSGALAFWIAEAPSSRDVDLIILPEEAADRVEAVMGELSWYHERHGAYVEVSGGDMFVAPESWMSRARRLTVPMTEAVTVLIPHPHDILLAKLERWAPHDQEHARHILASIPLDRSSLERLAAEMPHRTGAVDDVLRVRRFELNLATLRSWLPASH